MTEGAGRGGVGALLDRVVICAIAASQFAVCLALAAMAPFLAYGAMFASPRGTAVFLYLLAGLAIAIALFRTDRARVPAIIWFAIWAAAIGVALSADAKRPLPPPDPTLPWLPRRRPDNAMARGLWNWATMSVVYLTLSVMLRRSRASR
jgi:hypothetical protein